MNVAFYSFTKRRNSTKQPTGTGTVKDCKLKENCSIHDPVIISASNTSSYNYAYISTWGRYYFVTDTVYLANNLVEYHLTEDVLASNKTTIGSTKAMIAYASNHYSGLMVDSRIPAFAYKTAAGATGVDDNGNEVVVFDAGSDSYLLTVYNTMNSITSGFSTSYILGDAQLGVIRNWLGSGSVMDDISAFLHGNPMDAIFSCKWIPYKVNSADVSADTIVWIGDQFSDPMPSGTYAYRVKNFPYVYKTAHISRPYIHNDYRAWEPYTRGFVHLPGVGNVEINLGDWRTSKINVSVCIEVITGNVTYMLFRDDGALMQTFVCNVISDVPMGKMQGNGGNLLTALGTAVGGVAAMAAGGAIGAAGVALGGAAAAFTGTLNTALNANKHVPSIAGTAGGRSAKLWPYITFTEITAETEDPDDTNWIAEKGRPVGYVQTINTFSGYVQTIDAHVALSASEREMQEVNDFLDSGIYYE